ERRLDPVGELAAHPQLVNDVRARGALAGIERRAPERLEIARARRRERARGRRNARVEARRVRPHAAAGSPAPTPALAAASQITPPIAIATGTMSTARASVLTSENQRYPWRDRSRQ